MYRAFHRYIADPTVISEHLVNLDEASMPTITICTSHQFQAGQGFDLFAEFISGVKPGLNSLSWWDIARSVSAGHALSTNVSWTLSEGGYNFSQLTASLFKADYDQVEFLGPPGLRVRPVFILPAGHCQQFGPMPQGKKVIMIGIGNGSYDVFITDPKKSTYFKVDGNSVLGEKISLTTKPEVKRHRLYQIEIAHSYMKEGETHKLVI